MGFCRRCGDIVTGTRCKCGGSAVAPVVSWSPSKDRTVDRWSRTYTARETSPTRSEAHAPIHDNNDDTFMSTATTTPYLSSNSNLPTSSPAPVRRFPKPNTTFGSSSSSSSSGLSHRVSAHITSSTTRPPSPLKHSYSLPPTDHESALAAHEQASPTARSLAANILPSPYAPTLSKVYGSVLQPKESLASFACASCATVFPPDATIYPDPSSISSDSSSSTYTTDRFLCRTCFVANGGSKGPCTTCHRPVLIIKSEGGFIENSGRVWHKKCFRCDGCLKAIGDTPMVDLLGHPSCLNCFDTCLKRDKTPRKRESELALDHPLGNRDNIPIGKSREGSPAIEELEQRLGIFKERDREGTQGIEELSHRLSAVLNRTPTKDSPSTTASATSPLLSHYANSPDRDNSPLAARTRARAKSLLDISSPLTGHVSPSRTISIIPSTPDRNTNNTRPNEFSPPGSSPRNTLSPQSSERYSSPLNDSPKRLFSTESSPARYGGPVVSRPSLDAIEEMKRRFLHQSPSTEDVTSSYMPPTTAPSHNIETPSPKSSPVVKSSTPQKILPQSRIPVAKRTNSSPALRSRASTTSLASSRDRDSWILATPDLTSEFSDTMTVSSGPSSPPATGSPGFQDEVFVHRSSGEKRRSSRGEDIGGFGTKMADIDSAGIDVMRPSSSLSQQPLKPTYTGQSIKSIHTGQSIKPNHTSQSIRPNHTDQTINANYTGSTIVAATLSSDSLCAKCGGALFASRSGGRFVTVPEGNAGGSPKTYHTECFRCVICDAPFREGMETEMGPNHAVFVRTEGGVCHVECSPPERKVFRSAAISSPIIPDFPLTTPSLRTPALPSAPLPPLFPVSPYLSSNRSASLSTSSSSLNTNHTNLKPHSSRYLGPTTPAHSTAPLPRFGSSSSCPGCAKNVSPMERGVVPGPQGSRWHATCLVCGGKNNNKHRGRKAQGEPGCGKKLDSAAKCDVEGGVWCRECLLLLPMSLRIPQTPFQLQASLPPRAESPIKPLVPAFTNRSVGEPTTTIARQFTGIGAAEAALARQLTGGGLSPTRQLSASPMKMFDGPSAGGGENFHVPGTPRQRPKSVIGMRPDEGRGMFLVRQLTGGGGL